MNGVEILATKEIAVDFAFNWVAFSICFSVILAVLVLFGVFMKVMFDDWKQIIVGVVLGVIMGGAFGSALGFGNEIPTAFETQYKVIISDEVTMNEFIEMYEIVDQEGEIYTVREKE